MKRYGPLAGSVRFFFLSEDDHLVDGVGAAEALCELLDLPTQLLGSEANACFEGDMICMTEGPAWTDGLAEGRAMALEQAVDYALSETDPQ